MKTRNHASRLGFSLGMIAILGLAIPLAAAGQAERPKTAVKEGAAKLPPASEVIAGFVKAIGGKDAFSKIESQHGKGKYELPSQGISGDLEVQHKRPNKISIKIRIEGIGDVLTGFDGKVGWSVNPATGPSLLEGKALQQMSDQAEFDSVLHAESEYKSMETVELTQFDNKECFKLRLVRKSGDEVTEFYEKKTGLLAGLIMTQESPVGPMTVTNVLSGYKEFNGVMFATKVTQKMGPLEQTMVIHSYEINKVQDSAFELPGAIKALVKKP